MSEIRLDAVDEIGIANRRQAVEPWERQALSETRRRIRAEQALARVAAELTEIINGSRPEFG